MSLTPQLYCMYEYIQYKGKIFSTVAIYLQQKLASLLFYLDLELIYTCFFRFPHSFPKLPWGEGDCFRAQKCGAHQSYHN